MVSTASRFETRAARSVGDADLRLLVIAHAFPPSPEVGGHRVLRLCRYLPEHGVQPVVLTVRADCHRSRDETIPVPPGLRVERTGLGTNLLSLYGRLRASFGNPRVSSGAAGSPERASGLSAQLGLWRRQALFALDPPNTQNRWLRPALVAGSNLLRREHFDAIFSSGPPWTTHLIARRLKRRFHLPWIADYRDPWSGNHLPGTPLWRQALDERAEGACIREAELIVCNTEELRSSFRRRYPGIAETRFLTITNGFDTVGARPAMQGGRERICLHLGTLYGRRRIDTFCAALEELYDRGALAPFRVLLVGDTDAEFKRVAAKCAPKVFEAGLIEFRPPVPWSEAQSLLAAADLLLIFQGDHRLQVPAKFYDYLPTGKPILAVANQGALSRMLDETGSGLWVEPDDLKAIAESLLAAFTRPSRSPESVESRWSGTHHYRHLAGVLADGVRAVVDGDTEAGGCREHHDHG